jgi:hypothetical protein
MTATVAGLLAGAEVVVGRLCRSCIASRVTRGRRAAYAAGTAGPIVDGR